MGAQHIGIREETKRTLLIKLFKIATPSSISSGRLNYITTISFKRICHSFNCLSNVFIAPGKVVLWSYCFVCFVKQQRATIMLKSTMARPSITVPLGSFVESCSLSACSLPPMLCLFDLFPIVLWITRGFNLTFKLNVSIIVKIHVRRISGWSRWSKEFHYIMHFSQSVC